MIGKIALVLAAWNAVVLLIYGIDKWKAVHERRRIRERTLIWMAFLLGGIGAFLGMQVFHHKTRQVKFVILVPLAIVINAALAGICIWKWM